jgi:hypothetical protein
MKLHFVFCLVFATAFAAWAGAPPIIRNGDFSATLADNPKLPSEWRIDGVATDIAMDTAKTKSSRASLRVAYKAGAPYAGVIQTVSSEAVRGKRLTLRAQIARRGEKAVVGIWVGIFDKDKKRLAYRNSYETVQAADDSWVPHVVEIDVPENAERLLIGSAIYDADGVMWVDTISAEVK